MKSLLIVLLGLWGYGFAQVTPMDQSGPYAVGERDVTFTDNNLAEPSVNARVFYPASSAGIGTPVASGTYPVVAFGHGFNLNYLDYLNLNEHLASWGFMVITLDVQNGFNVDHQEYARELAAGIQYMQSEGQNTGSPFFQAVGSASGVYGHSMGGGASYLLPSVFSGIDAIAGLAAAETNPSAISALGNYGGPLLVISGSDDNVADEAGNQQPMYNAATGEKLWMSLQGAGHCKFTDGTTICDLVSGPGTMARAEVQRLSNRYTTAFFSYFLRGDSTALPYLCGDSILADEQKGLTDLSSNFTACLLTKPKAQSADAWEIWPNPAGDFLYIRGAGELEIYDAWGRKQNVNGQEQVATQVWDLSQLSQGSYWLRDKKSGQVRKLSLLR